MDSSLCPLLLLGTLVLPEACADICTRPGPGRSWEDPGTCPWATWTTRQRVVLVDPDYWERQTRTAQGDEQNVEGSLEPLRGYYNQSAGGVHTLQVALGSEVSSAGRFLRGSLQFAYDGLDYLALDTDTWTWRAAQPQAEISKRKLEAESIAERVKAFLEDECVQWVQKYLQMGREALTRTDPLSARVTRHTTPHGEVTLRCRAQDFYPSQISLTWLKDGEEQLLDTESIETRPGGDETFQKWAAVGVPQGQEGSYTCRVQHQSLAEPLNLKWESPSSPTRVIMGVIAGVLLTVGMAGVVIWRKKS